MSLSREELLRPYGNLKDKELAREMGLMLLEGPLLLQRALAEKAELVSVLHESGRELPAGLPASLPRLELSREGLQELCGFPFHRGVLSVARRPRKRSAEELVLEGMGSPLVLVLPEIQLQENLGALLRAAAAFAVTAVLLGERCCDPYGRRVLRASMGSALQLPLYHADSTASLADTLQRLREADGLRIFGSSAHGKPLDRVRPKPPCALLIGPEDRGLDPEWQQLCDEVLGISMAPGPDSLNAAMAGGILLYELRRT